MFSDIKKTNKIYSFKDLVNWRKEGNTLFFLEPRSGRLLIYNKAISRSVSSEGIIRPGKDNKDFMTLLVKNKLVDQVDKNYQPQKKQYVSAAPAPLNVTIQITNCCNLRCRHCHNNKNNPGDIDLILIKSLILQLREINVFNINISGGEPLLVRNIIDIISSISRAGINCTMSTNALILSDSLARRLSQAGLRRVHISLDSADEYQHDLLRGVKGSFKKMIDKLKYFKKYGIEYTFVTTLVDQDFTEYEKTIDLAYRLGARAHKTNTVVPQGRGKKLIANINPKVIRQYISIWKKKKKEYRGLMDILAETMFAIQIGKGMINPPGAPMLLKCGCPAGILTCAISATGDVLPCSFFTELTFGNLRKDTFLNIWNSSALNSFRNRSRIETCNRCAYGNSCGGCRARSYGYHNRLYAADPFCFKLLIKQKNENRS